MNVHKVEIAKTPHGEALLLDGTEVKGLKDFTLIRKENNLGVLQLEIYVGDVYAVDRQAKYEAKKFEEWAKHFNKSFETKLSVNPEEIAKAVINGVKGAINRTYL